RKERPHRHEGLCHVAQPFLAVFRTAIGSRQRQWLEYQPEVKRNLGLVARRVLLSLAGVALITFTAYRLIPLNPTTTGFAYLLFVLIIASTWGLIEASLTALVATLTFN